MINKNTFIQELDFLGEDDYEGKMDYLVTKLATLNGSKAFVKKILIKYASK